MIAAITVGKIAATFFAIIGLAIFILLSARYT